ncbi:MAG: Bug family tripartite tricarboxylate transporter substrate binding protein [Burkholderiales bacterium]
MSAQFRFIAGFLLCAGVLQPGHLLAQQYPAKPIRYIVPSSAGSAVDTIGRVVAAGLTDVLGQQVVVDDRPGAGGNIGAAVAAKAPPDGYTVLQVNNNHTTNVTLYKNLQYDLMRDFVPVTQLASSPYVIVVHPSLPVKSIAELIRLAKAQPGVVRYASAGAGSGTFMVTELFKSQTKLNMLHVPYNGGGPAITSVVSGETVLYGAPFSTALPFLKQGKLRPLAVSSPKRLAAFPQYPTVAETVPGYEFTAWAGLVLPTGTPKQVIDTLLKAAITALHKPDVAKRLSDLGYVPGGGQPHELAAAMKVEIEKMAKLIRENKLSVE